MLGGRGSGKTRCGAEDISDYCRRHPGHRVALVGPTQNDARDTMVEGESGLLSVLPASALRGGSVETGWNRSLLELFFANGAQAKCFSAEKAARLRGPQHHRAWCDEPAEWAHAGDVWDMLMFGLRLGERPQVVVTGTPKPVPLIKRLLGKMGEPHLNIANVHVTRCSTYDNLHNLAPTFAAQILSSYEGTRLGRQELHAELLEDVEGALWNLAQMDELRVADHPDLATVVVAIDPAGTAEDGSDETGIVTMGAVDKHGYVLDDRSGKYSPLGWAKAAIAAYHEHQADRIVAETNYGGDMVEATLRNAGFDGRFEKVTASRGKQQRAEPISAAYEQRRVHHVGSFPKLESQMCTWVPDSGVSPDRMDALVWAATSLKLGVGGGEAWLTAWKQMTAEETVSACEHFWFAGNCTKCGAAQT